MGGKRASAAPLATGSPAKRVKRAEGKHAGGLTSFEESRIRSFTSPPRAGKKRKGQRGGEHDSDEDGERVDDGAAAEQAEEEAAAEAERQVEGMADYERMPRMRSKWLTDERKELALPIKTASGEVIHRRREEVLSEMSKKRKDKDRTAKKSQQLAGSGDEDDRGGDSGGEYDGAGEDSGDESVAADDESDAGGEEGSPAKMSRRAKRIEEDAKKSEKKLLMKLKKGSQKKLTAEEQKKRDLATELEGATGNLRTLMILIAEWAERIMANPEGEMPRVTALLALCGGIIKKGKVVRREISKLTGQDDVALKLNLLVTLGLVFKDTLPAYRMKGLGEEEDEASDGKKFSFRFKKQQNYERVYLENYNLFIKLLKQRLGTHAPVLIPIVCELLKASPMFNFHADELLPLCIKYTGWQKRAVVADSSESKSSQREVADTCIECLRNLLENDGTLQVVQALVTAVGKWAQTAHRLNAKSKIAASTKNGDTEDRSSGGELRGLLKLPLTGRLLQVISEIDFKTKEAAVQLGDMTMKGGEDFDETTQKQWKMSRVSADSSRFKASEAAILREIFVIYLRILRSANLYSADVLVGVLLGLGKLSLRVNAELVSEIFVELKNLIQRSNSPPNVVLRALLCGLQILQGEGAALIVDVSWLCSGLVDLCRSCLPLLAYGAIPKSVIIGRDNSAAGGGRLQSFLDCAAPEEEQPTCGAAEDAPSSKTFSSFSLTQDMEMSSSADDVVVGKFASSLLRCIDLLLSSRQVFGKGAAGEHFVGTWASVLALVCSLVSTAACADSEVASSILREVVCLMRRFPRLKALVDVDGAVVNSLSEEWSIFWPMELAACQPSGKVTAATLALGCFATETTKTVERMQISAALCHWLRGAALKNSSSANEVHDDTIRQLTDADEALLNALKKKGLLLPGATNVKDRSWQRAFSMASDFVALTADAAAVAARGNGVPFDEKEDVSGMAAAVPASVTTSSSFLRPLFSSAAKAFVAEGGAASGSKSLATRLDAWRHGPLPKAAAAALEIGQAAACQ